MTRPESGRAARRSLARASTSARLVPFATARSLARWITGPSARGSLKGTPSSITSAPASMAASPMARVVFKSGSPAVRYATRPGLPSNRIGTFGSFEIEFAGKNSHVFIAASGEVDYKYFMSPQRRSQPNALGHGMRTFKRRQNSLRARQLHRRLKRRFVGGAHVLRTPFIMQRRMFGPNRRIVQPRRNRMRQRNLSGLVLQHIRIGPLQHARSAALKSRRVIA